MLLTDTAIRTAKPTERPQKLFDGDGLYLLIKPSGKKLWRFKYRIRGREKLLSFGAYPEVSLQAARGLRHEARTTLATGGDPSAERKAERMQPWPTKQSLYNRVAHQPGFADACIIRVGRRLLIDERRFLCWAKSEPAATPRNRPAQD